MHKLINGVRVEISKEEEFLLLEEWEQNRKELDKKKQYDINKNIERNQKLKNIADKLDLSTDDVIDLIKNIGII